MERLKEEEVRQVIREWVKSVGTIARASKIVGVTPAYMSDVVRGARAVGIKIPAYLGYTHVEYWEKPDSEEQNKEMLQLQEEAGVHEQEGTSHDHSSGDWF
jgi:hypothetical protein